MSKSSNKKKAVIEERYHGPLITNEVSLGYIKLYPWIALALTGFLYVGGTYEDNLGIFKGLSLFCGLVNILGIIISFIPYLVNAWKTLTYCLIALTVLSLVIGIDFIGLLMVISDGSSIGAKEIYQSPLTPFYVILMMFLFIFACGLYAWYYLPKNQGKVWAFNQVKEGDRKKTWWDNFAIAFAGATIIPSLLTGYIQIAFGVLLGILLTLTLPAVMVDAVYAAIYIRKHPDYEELT
ncbi:hypothetical protein [Abiotrophia defectiva]|uniref:hypothetical protein n=1 Tax=Abiotrophia defectiva TaxID=46125 RepID=UPI0028D81E11|nr:hypothetical protein [Abiotrophia defectiva]